MPERGMIMNVGYFLEKGINSLLKKYGVDGTINQIAGKVGYSLAVFVVRKIIAGQVTAAVAALGGKIGALAGPIGIGVGLLAGAL
jgi:hypothetical protein